MPIRARNTVGLLAAAALLGCEPERTTVPEMQGSPTLADGNGLPNNGHDRLYKFNVIGVPREKNPDMTGDAGKRIFVKLEGPSKIYLEKGEDFNILDANATWLKENADQVLLIEGHCDERGTNEYNLALGERRAVATMNYLIKQGIAADRISVISYGEERPTCVQRNEACWAKNRRAQFRVKAR